MGYPIRHCLKHQHSSDKTARKCYEKTLATRAERRLRASGEAYRMPKYRQVSFSPPKLQPIIQRNAEGKITKFIMLVYFYKGVAVGNA